MHVANNVILSPVCPVHLLVADSLQKINFLQDFMLSEIWSKVSIEL